MQKMPVGHSSGAATTTRLIKAVGRVPARLWLILVFLLAFAIRVAALGKSDLWLDEAISFFIAGKSPWEIILYTASHAFEHPPGYYLLLHFWIRLAGTEEFALRFLSVVGGMLAVALIAALARRWFSGRDKVESSTRLVLLVALLMALQPQAVFVSREVRMYAWMMALALLSIHALERAFLRNRWWAWGLFLVSIGTAVVFHYLAALYVAAYALFVVLFWRNLPIGRERLATILAVIFGLAGAWVFTRAGPRGTLLSVLSEPRQISQFVTSLASVGAHWALGNSAFYISALPAALLASSVWILTALGIVEMLTGRRVAYQPDVRFVEGDLRRRPKLLYWLIILLLLAPPLFRALLSPLPNVRHSAMMTGLFVLCTALGILAVFRRVRIAGLLLVVALVGLDGALWVRDLRDAGRSFSAPLDYIQALAGDSEPIVYTHPFDWPQNIYYNRRSLPAQYVPEELTPVTDEVATARAGQIMAQNPSAWLILYPSVLEPERVERAFNAVAFPIEKVWFPGGRGVTRYFSAHSPGGEDLHLEDFPGGLVWDNLIRLNRWMASGRVVNAGDALRLQFEWQRVAAAPQPGLIVLTLVGPDGAIWTKRVAAPCNGLCPTSGWTDEPVSERQALFVPADVPPGTYQLRIAWTTDQGVPILGRAEAAPTASSPAETPPLAGIPSGSTDSPGSGAGAGMDVAQVDLPLLTLEVTAPSGEAVRSAPLSKSLNSAAGPGLTLSSADFTAPSLRAGQALAIPMQWHVAGRQPALDARLTLASHKRQVQIVQSLGSGWYATTDWLPGRTIRTQSRFVVPGDLPAGEYNATLSVIETDTGQVRAAVALGNVEIVDRPHTFDLPELGSPLAVSWGNGIRLARIQAPERATAGQTLQMKLVWQADGPAERSWKVFIHLVDAEGAIRAQGDAYPQNGEALTTTWRKGEVIVDAYTISLPPDMPSGSYKVNLGFYDEPTGERLPLIDGGDALTLPDRLEVEPAR